MNKILKCLQFFLVLLMLTNIPLLSFAQGDPQCPADCPGGPFCPPECVPIDGGLSLLIAAGIGIAAKKSYDIRKKQRVK